MKISNAIMEKTMLRISTMSEKALETRVFKMTNPEKLEAFQIVAWQLGMRKLSKLAKEKLAFMN